MSCKRYGVDNTVQVDVDGVNVWLLRVTVLVNLEKEKVSARTNASVGENEVNFAMLLLGGLEELGQVTPFSYVSLDEQAVGYGRGWCLDVSIHN